MAKLSIMDHSGHSTVEFDKTNPATLAAAQAKFDELVGERKFTAAKIEGEGKNTVIRAFDPDAKEIVFMPPLQGG